MTTCGWNCGVTWPQYLLGEVKEEEGEEVKEEEEGEEVETLKWEELEYAMWGQLLCLETLVSSDCGNLGE